MARRLGWLYLLPFPVVLVLFVGMCTPTIANCGGADEALEATVAACPRAVELLGPDIVTDRFGFACGKSKVGSSSGFASWDIGISGARGDGRIEYGARLQDDEWRVTRASLAVGDETIDIMRCIGAVPAPVTTATTRAPAAAEAPAAPAPEAEPDTEAEPVAEPHERTGKVVRSTHRAVKAGMACRASFVPARATSAHAKVTCGPHAVYDGSGTYLRVADSDAVTFTDADEGDGTPRFSVAGAGTAVTMTVRTAAFEIVIASF